MKKKASVVTAAVAAVALALAGSAYGGDPYELKVKLKPVSETKLEYKGKVKAPSADCREDRVVSFKAGGMRLAKATTDDRGKFSEVGKRPDAGTEISVKLKPKGDDCPKLTAVATAP